MKHLHLICLTAFMVISLNTYASSPSHAISPSSHSGVSAHWGYEGRTGSKYWWNLSEAYDLCENEECPECDIAAYV